MSSTKQITLYTATFSPYAHRVRIALEEAGAEYTTCDVDVLRNMPDWFPLVNPLKKIPAMTFGGPEVPPDQPSPESAKIAESLAMLEFIADLFPEAKLLPTDPVLRARARTFMALYENYVNGQFRDVWFLGTPADPLLQALEMLQGALPPDGGFAAGEWSIADAAVIPFLARMFPYLEAGLGLYSKEDGVKMRKAMASERFARIRQYVRDCRARPSFANTWAGDAEQVEAAKTVPMLRVGE
ncbi:hypothetical protein VTO73DRAFT_8482 [Trametes versicolor]